jgi:Ca2+-binding EF-hand superfamily protein
MHKGECLMTTRSKAIIAVFVAAFMASITVVGTTLADRQDSDERHERHGYGYGMWKHRGHHGEHPGGERLLESFDQNNDGKLTQSEVDQSRQERFKKFDTNSDGNLSLQEYEALWLEAMRSRMVDRFQTLDDDGDAVVTTEEFVAPFDQLVNRMDRDDNGEVTRDELRRH